MPKSRGALKKYKTKVVRQKKKKVSGKLRTTLLPTAAELWKEKGTVRSNYAELGISAEINSDAAVSNVVHTKNGVLEGKRTSKLAVGTGQLQIASSGLALRAAEHGDAEDQPVSASQKLLADMEDRAQVADARVWMFEGDQEFVEKLEKKHGSNYAAMARDGKLNVYQHTPAQIKKKFEKYYKFKGLGISKNRSGATQLPCHTYNMGPGKQKAR